MANCSLQSAALSGLWNRTWFHDAIYKIKWKAQPQNLGLYSGSWQSNSKTDDTETNRKGQRKNYFHLILKQMVINTTKWMYSKPAERDVKMFLINLPKRQDWTGTLTTQKYTKKFIAGFFL